MLKPSRHDRQTGTTERVSVDSAGNQGNGDSTDVALSADGRFVAFTSVAPDLVTGDTNGAMDVFVHDRQTGTAERVSVDSAGNQANGDSTDVALSADGRFVAFTSAAPDLVAGDTNGAADVFVHDRQTGTTERVSVDSAGTQANGSSFGRALSADGRFVAFISVAPDLVAGDTNGVADVFVHDRQTGTTERVSVDSAGNQANGDSTDVALRADGRFVAFTSAAPDLVAGDTNGAADVFVHDRGTTDTTPPTAPGNLVATAVSSSQIDLSWTASTDDVGVTGYRVDRCQGAGCTSFTQIATPTGTSHSDTGLAPSTSYSYQVTAVDAAGNVSTASAPGTAGTPADTTPPSAPTGLTATAASATEITLSWTASTDDVGVTGYQVERCPGAECTTFTPVAAALGTSYSDTGLAPNTS